MSDRVPMAFEGDLEKLPLGDVLQTLAMTRQFGVLTVEGPRRRRVFVDERGVVLLSVGRETGERVARYLLATGGLNFEQLAEAEKVARRQRNARMDRLLESEGLVPADTLRTARSYVAQEDIFEMFSWRRGAFSLEERSPSREDPISRIAFDVNGLMMEAARRLDESTRLDVVVPPLAVIVPGDPARAPDPGTDGESVCAVHGLVNDVVLVSETVASSHLGAFDTRKALEYLIESGAVRHADETQIAAAAEAGADRDAARAARLYGRLVELLPNDPQVVGRYAEILEKSGDPRGAATAYVRLGRTKHGLGDLTTAREAYRNARRVDPELPDAHLSLIECCWDAADADAALDATHHALAPLAEAGLHESVYEIAQRAASVTPDDDSLHLAAASALEALGRVEEAETAYRTALAECESAGRPVARRTEVLRRLVRIASDPRPYKRQLARLDEVRSERRRRMRKLALVAAGLLVAAAVAVPLATGVSTAERLATAHAHLAAGDVDAAERLAADLGMLDLDDDTRIELGNLTAAIQRARGPVEDPSQRLADSIAGALDARYANALAESEALRATESLSILAGALELIQSGDGAKLRAGAPAKHAALLEEFASQANALIAGLRDSIRRAATETESVLDRFPHLGGVSARLAQGRDDRRRRAAGARAHRAERRAHRREHRLGRRAGVAARDRGRCPEHRPEAGRRGERLPRVVPRPGRADRGRRGRG